MSLKQSRLILMPTTTHPSIDARIVFVLITQTLTDTPSETARQIPGD